MVPSEVNHKEYFNHHWQCLSNLANHPLHQKLTQNPCATKTTAASSQLPAQEQDLPVCNLPKSKAFIPFCINPHTKYYVSNFNAIKIEEW